MRKRRPCWGVWAAGLWVAAVFLVGVFAPALASGHPLVVREFDAATATRTVTWTITSWMRPMDVALLASLPVLVLGLVLPARSGWKRLGRTAVLLLACLLAGAIGEAVTPVRLAVFDPTFHQSTAERSATFAVVPFSPGERIPGADARFAPPGTAPEAGSGRVFGLGSDGRGQDVRAHLIHGARTAVLVSLGATGIAMAIGIGVGAVMGWFGGWVDAVLMRIVEGAMAIPVLLILVVAAGVLPRLLGITILVIGMVTWTDAARLMRAECMRLRDQDFILAARASGASPWRIITRHLLPSALPPLLVEASFALAAAVLYEASLSFLGLGPTAGGEGASWGRLLAASLDAVGRPVLWLSIPAGAMIFLTAMSLHTIGDTLRHALARQ